MDVASFFCWSKNLSKRKNCKVAHPSLKQRVWPSTRTAQPEPSQALAKARLQCKRDYSKNICSIGLIMIVYVDNFHLMTAKLV
jgi:hypothetical protein